MNEKLATVLVVGLLVVIAGTLMSIAFRASSPIEQVSRLGDISQTVTPNFSSSSVTSTIKIALPARSGVQLRCVANSGANDVYLGFGTSTGLSSSSASLPGTGYLLKASSTNAFGQSQCFFGESLYGGNWYVAPNGTTTLVFTEL